MYLGMILIIISTSIFYLNYYSILTPFIFYFWINEFQIKEKKFFFKKNLEKNIYLINPELEDGYSNFR